MKITTIKNDLKILKTLIIKLLHKKYLKKTV